MNKTQDKAKHTQGVWTFGKTNNFEYFDIDCNGNRICSVYCGVDTPEEEREEAKANAMLIASAPDLLKALKEAMKIIVRIENPHTNNKHLMVSQEEMELLNFAVQRATIGGIL
jgi:hypothetical protein